MRIFSKAAFICNLGFLAAFFLQVTDASVLPAKAPGSNVVSPAIILILTLYMLSAIVNFMFLLFALSFIMRGKEHSVPKWVLYFNFVILIWQFFYFFII